MRPVPSVRCCISRRRVSILTARLPTVGTGTIVAELLVLYEKLAAKASSPRFSPLRSSGHRNSQLVLCRTFPYDCANFHRFFPCFPPMKATILMLFPHPPPCALSLSRCRSKTNVHFSWLLALVLCYFVPNFLYFCFSFFRLILLPPRFTSAIVSYARLAGHREGFCCG